MIQLYLAIPISVFSITSEVVVTGSKYNTGCFTHYSLIGIYIIYSRLMRAMWRRFDIALVAFMVERLTLIVVHSSKYELCASVPVSE